MTPTVTLKQPGTPLSVHILPKEHFQRLASGEGNRETVRLLLDGEDSRRRLLLWALLDLASRRPGVFGPLPSTEDAWQSLTATAGPKSEAAMTDVLMHPQVGTWISSALRRLRIGATDETPDWVEIGQVHAVAFAVAIRAGVPHRGLVPLRQGRALIPTLGLASFDSTTEWGVAVVETIDGHARLRVGTEEILIPTDPETSGTGWWGLRRLRSNAAGRGFAVWLDDLDPYRDLADPVPPARLDEADFRRWQKLLNEAWHMLSGHYPDTADAMSRGISSIAPLPLAPGSTTRSASTGDGFGAALISPPPDAPALALALVHEFQHMKLGGLLHLTTLYHDGGQSEALYAPWRDDPRPFAGLFQGVYAFLGITDFWRRHREASTDEEHDLASFEFAYARRQTWEALGVLSASPKLTALGAEFVKGMTARLRPWLSEPVNSDVVRAAWAAAADHRAAWRARNLRPEPETVSALLEAWLVHRDPPAIGPSTTVTTPSANPDQPWQQARLALYRMRIASPPGVRHAYSDGEITRRIAGITAADLALVGGQSEAAVTAYGARIDANLDDADAWAGLGLAAAATGRPAWRPLLYQPHVVRAVFAALRQRGATTDPISLAEWLNR